MHKDKKGRVLASLTEVKNKTGDIFALVDEFGEVYITSYNKTRYRISKMDITSILEEKEAKPKQKKVAQKKEVAEVKATEETPEVVVEKVEEKNDSEEKMESIEISAYDRNNKMEQEFVDNSTKALL